MKHIHTFEEFLNESNRSKRGNNKINFLKDSTSEVDHTRLVKWMGKNIDSNKYYFEKSKTVGYWILDVEKLSEGELKDLLQYLDSEKYKFSTQIWLPAYESEINEGATPRLLKSAGQNLARQVKGIKNYTEEQLKDRLLSTPVARMLSDDEILTVLDHAKKELGMNESRDDRGAMEFNKSMLDMEDEVKKHSKPNWKKFEKSSGEFWKELNVESWADAFEKDSASCMSFKEELESYLR